MDSFWKTIKIDNVNAELFAPAGTVVRGSIGWEFQNYPFASIVFDTFNCEAVLSVGEKDILPRTVTVRNNQNGDGGIEYAFGEEKGVVLSVNRSEWQSVLNVVFTERKEVVAHLNIRFSKRGIDVRMWGDPYSALQKLNKQTKGETDHDTRETDRVTVATVSD